MLSLHMIMALHTRLQIILDAELAAKVKEDAWRARKSVSEYVRDLMRKA